MDKLPNGDPRLWEAIEACRPRSQDLSDPAMQRVAEAMAASRELGEAYARLQRVDEVVAEAFADVDVPQGLAERILASLEQAQSASSVAVALLTAAPVIDAAVPAAIPTAQRPYASRWRLRWAIAASAAAAAVLLAAVGLVLQSGSAAGVSSEEFLGAAIAQFNTDRGAVCQYRAAPMPSSYPISSALPWHPQQMPWREVAELAGSRGVAYDFVGPDGLAATLYVLDRQRDLDLAPSPPEAPGWSTAGSSAAAWEEGGLVYVLVVAGGEEEYRRLMFPSGSGPVA